MKKHRTQQTVGSLSVVAAQGWGPGTGKHWVTGFLRAQGSWDCGTRSGVDPAAHPPSPSLKLWREAEWDTILGRGGKSGLGGLCHLCEVLFTCHAWPCGLCCEDILGHGDRTSGPAEPPAIQPFTGRIASSCQPGVDSRTQWTPHCGPSRQDRRLWALVAACVPTNHRVGFFPFFVFRIRRLSFK